MHSITLEDVSKSHGARLLLDRVSLVVGAGSRIGVVGSNGVGKTTLLRLLAGLDAPDSGSVRRSPPSLAVGYLPQELDARPGETLLAYLERRTGVARGAAEMEQRDAADIIHGCPLLSLCPTRYTDNSTQTITVHAHAPISQRISSQ